MHTLLDMSLIKCNYIYLTDFKYICIYLAMYKYIYMYLTFKLAMYTYTLIYVMQLRCFEEKLGDNETFHSMHLFGKYIFENIT